MDLWIKVQNNKKLKQGLVKVNDLFVEKDSEDGKWRITQCCDTLGIYKTEKRALAILDEIQNHIENFDKTWIDLDGYKNTNKKVYEMPKE